MGEKVLITNPDYDKVKTIYEFTVLNIRGEPVKLNVYEGHVCIIVNVASLSGFTDFNYKLLNKLYDKYSESQGLRILAFPCNQFGLEEPGTPEDIQQFTADRGVKFDVFDKVLVNGDDACPLWKYLKKSIDIGKVPVITSNFTKFVVSRTGIPSSRLPPQADEEQLTKAIEIFFTT